MNSPADDGAGHRKRLRRRFDATAFKGFQDYEVLEYLLTFVIPRKDTKPIAKALIRRFGNLPAVFDADPALIQSVEGIGERAAGFMAAIREAARRYGEESIIGKEAVGSVEAVVAYARTALAGLKHESFHAIFVSAKNRILGVETLAEGSVDRATIYPRKIFEAAVKNGAEGIILIHNHPSGDPRPSKEDVDLTRKLAKLAKELDITVHDHVVIGREGFVSLQREGVLDMGELWK